MYVYFAKALYNNAPISHDKTKKINRLIVLCLFKKKNKIFLKILRRSFVYCRCLAAVLCQNAYICGPCIFKNVFRRVGNVDKIFVSEFKIFLHFFQWLILHYLPFCIFICILRLNMFPLYMLQRNHFWFNEKL